MTLRVRHDEMFRRWFVEYLNTWTGSWNTCHEYYNGKDTFASFSTEEEANEFMNWKYRKYEEANKRLNHTTPCIVPDDYYGTPGRYYGD